ncbi:MAG: hypothetical protein CSB13_06715 [Chloroflexi bacterium]|nr:MAG: hypothetical protein CSB13_06715 [Chloroflexota bacterium]
MKKTIIISLLFLLILTACGNKATADPAQTVERYLQAKANRDTDTIQQLLCSEMESVLERESRTFESVTGVHIEDMACTDEGGGRVNCTGSIMATYGSEDTEFPLTAYRVVKEDGEWKWCGESS